MIIRWVAIVAVGAALAFLAVASAIVARYSARAPETAGRIWPSHPYVQVNRALVDIARSVSLGRDPEMASVDLALVASRKAPLMAEPFLVRGAQAKAEGKAAVAERAFIEARRRNARADAARYFLAEHYLRTGRVREGLEELSALAMLAPSGGDGFAKLLAAYARTANALPHLKRLFRTHPRLEPAVLQQLAAEAGNAELVLELASPNAYQRPELNEWLPALLTRLVERGEYSKAFQLWRRVAGLPPTAAGIFDPQFRGSDAPPPFNWTFSSSGAGFAEPVGDGSLRLLYYGRENVVLAQQLLLLQPGAYRLAMELTGPSGRESNLAWKVTCLPGRQRLLELPLAVGGSGGLAAAFGIPAGDGCRAQQLELVGTAPEFPQQADVVISKLQLTGPLR